MIQVSIKANTNNEHFYHTRSNKGLGTPTADTEMYIFVCHICK